MKRLISSVISVENVMIRASAGSGKTWQLANRYLALLALGVKPERIIALTFTRKAAGEFADRILSRLAEGAESEENAKELAEQLHNAINGGESSGMPPLVSARVELPVMGVAFFQDLLESVVRVMDELALSTLDSFFVKLLRNFAFEMGMSGFELLEGYDLETERLRVFADIFQRRSDGGGMGKDMDEFIGAFSQTSAGDEGIGMTGRLEEFVKSHQYRWLKHPEMENWGSEEVLWPEGSPWPEGGDYRKKSQRVIGLLDGREFADRRYLPSLIKMCEVLGDRDGKIGIPLPKSGIGRLSHMLDNISDLAQGCFIDVFYKKEMVIDGELAEAIHSLIGAYVSDEIKAKLERTRGVYNVIKAFEERYNTTVRGQGKLGFSDATLLLSGQDSTGLFDEVSKELVEFRFDGKYDHWMLDEFQDTSGSQWKVIKNLVDEVVHDSEGERSLFVVGDTKQGIYGWRGGDPRLFGELHSRYDGLMKEWNMDVSYRSSASVLSLVNKVCDPLSRGMQMFPKAALARWKFDKHEAAVKKRGHSWVCEMEKVEGVDATTIKHEWIGALVQKIDPTRRGLSCAILVRKNNRAREIAEYLREHHAEIAVAVEDETLVAEENPVSAVIVDAFRFLCYPLDSLAWQHVLMSPFGKVFHDYEESDNKHQSKTWYRWNSLLSEKGIDVVLNEWIVELQKVTEISNYSLGKLEELELAASAFAEKGGSLAEWLKVLEKWSQREVTRAGVVQIMTVHKAKGLGFDAVILPDLENSPFDDEGRLSTLEKDGHVMLAPVKEVRRADGGLKKQVEQWREDQCYEQFCVLYVMLTRAVHGTYCLLDAGKNKAERKWNEADWMRESIGNSDEREEELGGHLGRVIYEDGDWSWIDSYEVREQGSEENKESTTILPVTQTRQRGVIASVQRVNNFGQTLMNRSGLEFGNRMHACLESIEWWDGIITWDGDEQIRKIVKECMNEATIRPYFIKKEGLKVYREQSIETIVEGTWLSGVIDRLILAHDAEGNVEDIAIVDFKADQVASIEELKQVYRGQVEQYKKMMGSIYSIGEERVFGVLISTHLRTSCTL